MKRLAAFLLSIAAVVLTFPVSIPASASSGDDLIIDMHGDKTWIGTSSDWGKTWNENNFDDVTGKNITKPVNVTVKSGIVGDITLDNDSNLDIEGGAVGDTDVGGTITMKKGNVKSLEANGDITVSGGNVRHDVTSDGDITLQTAVDIGGSVKGRNITLDSSVKASVSGTIQGRGNIMLNDCSLKTKGFDGNGNGDNSGSLEIKGYKSTLPPIENMDGIVVDSDTTALVNDSITANSLYIKDKAEFVTTSTLDLDSLQGPGTLSYQAGKMTIHSQVLGTPLLVFSNPVENGTIAFKADAGCVDPEDVDLYNFDLNREPAGSYDEFKLSNSRTDGITFDKGYLSVDSKTPGKVTASIKPDLSKYADGTKVVWKLYGDTSAISHSEGSTLISTVSVSDDKMHRATLVAYLVDKNGDRLRDYRSASCAISAGYPDDNEGTNTSGLSLDTSKVSILTGSKYSVMALPSSTSAAPHSMSYDSSVATVGAGTAATDKNGHPGFLYPVTGIGKGETTIDIGGQKVDCTVSNGIMVDTSSYTMSPGRKYIIGVRASGIDYHGINVSSVNNCTEVQFLKKAHDGMLLYSVTAKASGTGYVMFDVSGGRGLALKTQFDIQSGASPHGSSARMVLLA